MPLRALNKLECMPLHKLFLCLHEYGQHHNMHHFKDVLKRDLIKTIPTLQNVDENDYSVLNNHVMYSLEDALFDVEEWALHNLTFDAALLENLDALDCKPILIKPKTASISDENVLYLSIISWCQQLHDMPGLVERFCHDPPTADVNRMFFYTRDLTRFITALSNISCQSTQAQQRNRMAIYCLHHLVGIDSDWAPLNMSLVMIKHKLCVTLACLARMKPVLLGYVRIAQNVCIS